MASIVSFELSSVLVSIICMQANELGEFLTFCVVL